MTTPLIWIKVLILNGVDFHYPGVLSQFNMEQLYCTNCEVAVRSEKQQYESESHPDSVTVVEQACEFS